MDPRNIDILCLQEVQRIDASEQHEFDKNVKGIGIFNTNVGFIGTAIVVRQNIQKLKIEHMEINNNILNERLTHIKITSKETLHALSVYAPPNNSEKKGIFLSTLKRIY